jgi:broad specificity phosphatase PhoE
MLGWVHELSNMARELVASKPATIITTNLAVRRSATKYFHNPLRDIDTMLAYVQAQGIQIDNELREEIAELLGETQDETQDETHDETHDETQDETHDETQDETHDELWQRAEDLGEEAVQRVRAAATEAAVRAVDAATGAAINTGSGERPSPRHSR